MLPQQIQLQSFSVDSELESVNKKGNQIKPTEGYTNRHFKKKERNQLSRGTKKPQTVEVKKKKPEKAPQGTLNTGLKIQKCNICSEGAIKSNI